MKPEDIFEAMGEIDEDLLEEKLFRFPRWQVFAEIAAGLVLCTAMIGSALYFLPQERDAKISREDGAGASMPATEEFSTISPAEWKTEDEWLSRFWMNHDIYDPEDGYLTYKPEGESGLKWLLYNPSTGGVAYQTIFSSSTVPEMAESRQIPDENGEIVIQVLQDNREVMTLHFLDDLLRLNITSENPLLEGVVTCKAHREDMFARFVGKEIEIIYGFSGKFDYVDISEYTQDIMYALGELEIYQQIPCDDTEPVENFLDINLSDGSEIQIYLCRENRLHITYPESSEQFWTNGILHRKTACIYNPENLAELRELIDFYCEDCLSDIEYEAAGEDEY